VRIAPLDPATAFWLSDAALISAALAKAQESIEVPDNRFIASPIMDFRAAFRPASPPRKTSIDPCAIDEQKINAKMGHHVAAPKVKPRR
jgi:hypothetical protein